ncbi:hypothetical protein FACS1894196_3670 [Clostridia bacterium]|nr:hypothetical protein FACS1894196_3670 [Clostridia bacterium]
MKNPARKMSIRNQFKLIVLGFMILLFGLQFLMQSFFVGALRTLYMDNVASAIDAVALDLRALLQKQSSAVAHIADEQDVKLYAAATDARERYRLAYAVVGPIVRSTTQNLPIDQLVIYDTTKAWYQFIGSMPYAHYRALRDLFSGLTERTTRALALDDTLYFCTAAPLLSVSQGRLRHDGLIVALTGAPSIRAALRQNGTLPGDATVMLHDDEIILLANDPALEGLPLADSPLSRSRFYLSSDTILPSLSVTVSIPRDQIFPQQVPYILTFFIVALFSILALSVTVMLSNRWFSKPVTQVVTEMGGLGAEGNRLRATGVAHVDSIVSGVNGLLSRLEESTRAMISAQQTLYTAELERQQAQLSLLKKQINAHFLYNCLAGIKTLTDEGAADKAGEMAQGVAMLMRYTYSEQETVNVFEEMRIVQRYIDIMNIRFSDRFAHVFDVDDQLVDYRMPRLLLQPLVENALVHGLEKRETGGILTVMGKMDGDTLLFTVRDNGTGFPAEKLAMLRAILAQADKDTAYTYLSLQGISLANIQKRVYTAYGAGYGLTVDSRAGTGTCVTLRIPAVTDTAYGE